MLHSWYIRRVFDSKNYIEYQYNLLSLMLYEIQVYQFSIIKAIKKHLDK